MVKVKLFYSDGDIQIKEFDNITDMNWYIAMEGDHLVHFEWI